MSLSKQSGVGCLKNFVAHWLKVAVTKSAQNDIREPLNKLWSAVQRKRGIIVLVPTKCFSITTDNYFFCNTYAHRTRELENLLRTLSASVRPRVGFRKGWASARSPTVDRWVCFLSCDQSTWRPSKGSAVAGGQSPRPPSTPLTGLVWTPLPNTD